MKKAFQIYSILMLLVFLPVVSACSPVEEDNSASFQIETINELDLLIEGRIIPKQWVVLSFSGSGLVDEIYYEIGETVQEGDSIAQLSGHEQLAASLAAAELELLSAQQALDSLDNNHELLKTQVLSERVQLQQAILYTEIDLKNLKEKDWEKEIESARANIVLLDNRLEQAQNRYNDYKDWSDDNLNKAEARINLSNALQQLEEGVALLNKLENRDADLEIKNAETELSLLEEQLSQAVKKEAELKNGPLPEEMELLQQRLKTAKAGVDSAQAAINSLQLIAPFDGVILESALKRGQFILAGQQAIILADTSEWIVETNDLTEIERGNVTVNQLVIITPDAYPDMEIEGFVLRISEYFQENRGDITYKTIIQLSEAPELLYWGMTVLINFR